MSAISGQTIAALYTDYVARANVGTDFAKPLPLGLITAEPGPKQITLEQLAQIDHALEDQGICIEGFRGAGESCFVVTVKDGHKDKRVLKLRRNSIDYRELPAIVLRPESTFALFRETGVTGLQAEREPEAIELTDPLERIGIALHLIHAGTHVFSDADFKNLGRVKGKLAVLDSGEFVQRDLANVRRVYAATIAQDLDYHFMLRPNERMERVTAHPDFVMLAGAAPFDVLHHLPKRSRLAVAGPFDAAPGSRLRARGYKFYSFIFDKEQVVGGPAIAAQLGLLPFPPTGKLENRPGHPRLDHG